MIKNVYRASWAMIAIFCLHGLLHSMQESIKRVNIEIFKKEVKDKGLWAMRSQVENITKAEPLVLKAYFFAHDLNDDLTSRMFQMYYTDSPQDRTQLKESPKMLSSTTTFNYACKEQLIAILDRLQTHN